MLTHALADEGQTFFLAGVAGIKEGQKDFSFEQRIHRIIFQESLKAG